jgi:hypothetical protein
MEVIKTIRPGRDGSKRYLETYGEQLVCVRYRRDREQHRNVVTIELVVDQIPQPRPVAAPGPEVNLSPNRIVFLKVASYEHQVQQSIRNRGGSYDRDCNRWRLSLGEVQRLGLNNRIDRHLPVVPEEAPIQVSKADGR